MTRNHSPFSVYCSLPDFTVQSLTKPALSYCSACKSCCSVSEILVLLVFAYQNPSHLSRLRSNTVSFLKSSVVRQCRRDLSFFQTFIIIDLFVSDKHLFYWLVIFCLFYLVSWIINSLMSNFSFCLSLLLQPLALRPYAWPVIRKLCSINYGNVNSSENNVITLQKRLTVECHSFNPSSTLARLWIDKTGFCSFLYTWLFTYGIKLGWNCKVGGNCLLFFSAPLLVFR